MKTFFLPWFAGVLLLAGNHPLAAATHYVDLNSANPVSPFTSWATAATNIQDAVDAAVSGDLVLVTNGIYATGGRMWFDSGVNRVTVTNSIVLQSVNGPTVTVIQGAYGSGTNAVRCVMLTTTALLSGFTLTNGQSGIGNYPQGGGVYCSSGSTVSNCVLLGNVARSSGGGAYRGVLLNCVLKGNSATNYGGGASDAKLTNCIVIGNSANRGGGLKGIYGGTFAINSLIVSNTATTSAGAAYEGNFVNCTIVGNTAGSSVGAVEGNAGLDNCIVYYNSAPVSPNGVGKFNNICLQPPLPGYGSGITNEPAFVDLAAGNFRLQTNSPCINAGNNSYISTSADLDGNQRIAGSTVDLGAYEYQLSASVLPYVWAQQYGLATDGSADYADPDGDGMNNWREWRTGTNPTNSTSLLQMNSPSLGVTLTWQGANGVNYFVQRSSDLSAASNFVTIRTNLVGHAGTMSYTDTSATNGVPYFYRVGVP